MTWFKSTRSWAAIVSLATAVVLAIVCHSFREELVRTRADLAVTRVDSDKFKEYCARVRIGIESLEDRLLHPIRFAHDTVRDEFEQNYALLKMLGYRDRADVALCVTRPIDFNAIDDRYYSCTDDRFTCLAHLVADVRQHLRKPFE